MRKFKKFIAKHSTNVARAGAVAVTGLATVPAFAAGEVEAALTAGIDKGDLMAGGIVILGACAVIAMIALGRRLAK
ncbi:hypothetical protein [uncultured Pseudoxanthomonas sp.]|uniref:hypothetical protein n=1 Tax=uncultured Pseudoxanthomonas sp. TaxID=281701 RepID=UPI0025985446|nr:hypothetical protein [uncultured Pseudoxanthomonas sp.]